MTFSLENPALALEARALASGVSINELCEAAKVARSTFVRWKNGKTSPTFSKIQELETALKEINHKSALKSKHKARNTTRKAPVNK